MGYKQEHSNEGSLSVLLLQLHIRALVLWEPCCLCQGAEARCRQHFCVGVHTQRMNVLSLPSRKRISGIQYSQCRARLRPCLSGSDWTFGSGNGFSPQQVRSDGFLTSTSCMKTLLLLHFYLKMIMQMQKRHISISAPSQGCRSAALVFKVRASPVMINTQPAASSVLHRCVDVVRCGKITRAIICWKIKDWNSDEKGFSSSFNKPSSLCIL